MEAMEQENCMRIFNAFRISGTLHPAIHFIHSSISYLAGFLHQRADELRIQVIGYHLCQLAAGGQRSQQQTQSEELLICVISLSVFARCYKYIANTWSTSLSLFSKKVSIGAANWWYDWLSGVTPVVAIDLVCSKSLSIESRSDT